MQRRRRGPRHQLFVPAGAFEAGENEWEEWGGLKDALFQLFDIRRVGLDVLPAAQNKLEGSVLGPAELLREI